MITDCRPIMPHQAYQAKLLKGPFDAIVIGSGIGGLACAAFLSKAGKRVLVLERHYVAGGFTHTFKRKGYEWDVGVHYIGEVHRPSSVLRKLFDTITGDRLGWAPTSEIYDRVCIGDAGGQVLVRADVQQIITCRGATHGVRLKNGDEIMAPLVISDAGVANTYGRLLSADDREKFGVMNLLREVHPSLAHICLYIGIKKSSRDLELGKANYWIYPHYDHDQSIADYLRDPASPLPVAYISFPSAKDPSWDERYPGRATLEVIGFTPYAWFKKWEQTAWMKRGDEYQAYKEKLTERLLEQLFRFVPQVKNCIDHHELSTPLSTRHFCNYENGEIYGIEHTPERFRLKWLKPQTPVKGLYLTGQDIVTDGIGGALFAGVLTASAILKKNLIKQVLAS